MLDKGNFVEWGVLLENSLSRSHFKNIVGFIAAATTTITEAVEVLMPTINVFIVNPKSTLLNIR